MTAFVAGGYLNLEDIHKTIATNTLKMDPSAGYVKVGLHFDVIPYLRLMGLRGRRWPKWLGLWL